MATADETAPFLAAREENRALGDSWRALRRTATVVVVLARLTVAMGGDGIEPPTSWV